jgi:hypothetical protein
MNTGKILENKKSEERGYNRSLIAFIFIIGSFVPALNQTVLVIALPHREISASERIWRNGLPRHI